MKYEDCNAEGPRPKKELIEGPGGGRAGVVAGETGMEDWRVVMSILCWSWERRRTVSGCDISTEVSLYGIEVYIGCGMKWKIGDRLLSNPSGSIE